MSYSSSAFNAFRGEPQYAAFAQGSGGAAQVPPTAERWLRGNPGRTIYTQNVPLTTNSVAVAGKQPSPAQPAFGSENAAPNFASDFDWLALKAEMLSRESVPSSEPFGGIPRPERTPLGNTSNFPSSISGNSDVGMDFESVVAQLQDASGYASYGQSSGYAGYDQMSEFRYQEPLMNGNLKPQYRRCRTPEPAPYERSIEEEGLLKFVEPHWLMLKQASPRPAQMALPADASMEADVDAADQMSDEGNMSYNSCFDAESFDDSFGSISSVERSLSPPSRECSASGDEAGRDEAFSSRSSSPASSVEESSEEEYLPLASNIRIAPTKRQSKQSQPQKRAQPYPTSRPRRNKQVDVDDDVDFSPVVPPSASHPSLSLASSSTSTHPVKYAWAISPPKKTSSSKKAIPELGFDVVSCPICDFVPGSSTDDADENGSTSKGLSSERRRTLNRHYETHFESSRVICVEKPSKLCSFMDRGVRDANS